MRSTAETPFTLAEYSAGARQSNAAELAEFLAPIVPVSAPKGDFQKWDAKSRYFVPDSLRACRGGALQLGLDASSEMFDCTPFAVEVPVDRAFGASEAALLADGEAIAADVTALVHFFTAVQLAKAAAGAGEDIEWQASDGVIQYLEERIRALILRTKAEGVALLFGARAWQIFKNHPDVLQRCPGGPDFDKYPGLFAARAEYRASYAIHDANPPGLAEDIQFVLDEEVLIFSRSAVPTRRDPSFMKTFRLRDYRPAPAIWNRADGRVATVAVDWSGDIHVTNTLGVTRLNFKA